MRFLDLNAPRDGRGSMVRSSLEYVLVFAGLSLGLEDLEPVEGRGRCRI